MGKINIGERTTPDEFDSLDDLEKDAVKGALNRCRVIADQIECQLRNKRPEHFMDKVSLADICASLEASGQAPHVPAD
jgi:hypothetical protein